MFPAIDRSLASRSAVSDSPVASGPVAGGCVAGGPVAGGPVSAGPVAGSALAAARRDFAAPRAPNCPGGPDFPAGPGSPGGPRARRSALTARAGRALIALGAAATILIGCPLYSDECDSRNDCASGFYCESFSRQCEPILDAIACSRPSQCEVGETCTPDFVCRPGSCDYHGCVRGYRCGVVDFAHTCVPALDDGGADAASAPSPADAGDTDGGDELDAGTDGGDAAVDASP
jgi:hypothetical protein